MAGGNPIHYDPAFAKAPGSQRQSRLEESSAFLSEMLTKAFGIDWIRSGSIDVKFIRPIYAGDMVTVRGRITSKRETSTGMRIALDIWCETQRGEPVTVGTGSVVVH